ncbi:MAG: efflux transporter outer membrane subunit, partial [Polyangiales bacterium]
GRIRSASHAAQENYFASQSGARAVRLTLIADTASAWLNIAAQRSLLAIARQTEESAAESVRVTQSRMSGGVASELDVRQAETILAQAKSDVAAYTTTAAQAENALVLLVGTQLTAADLPGDLESSAGLADVPAGLSSQVLLVRPDVLQAEHTLKAANANIGAARAAFFPRLSLTALGGFMSSALESLFTLGGAAWQLAPSASLPIFTGGANEARLAYARAQQKLYLASYERTIQRAFREVADALARRGTIEAQLSAQRELVAASEASYTLSQARYKAGADTYLNALDSQRTLYAARRTLVLTELSRADNLVTLYRVLGGGS